MKEDNELMAIVMVVNMCYLDWDMLAEMLAVHSTTIREIDLVE